jgi:hypothetical protein
MLAILDWVSQEFSSRGDKHYSQRFIGYKALVEIVEFYFALGTPVVNVNSGKSVATATEVRIEVHPLSTQRSQPFTVPQITR